MLFNGEIIANSLNLEDIYSENGGLFKLEKNSFSINISNSYISNLNAIINNSSYSGFFLTIIRSDSEILLSNFTAYNNILKGEASLFYTEKNMGKLNLINCLFVSNTAFSLFTIKFLYKLDFYIFISLDNNNAFSCFYFENVLMQNFSKILIENSKSNGFGSSMIFIDEQALMTEFYGFYEDSYVFFKDLKNIYK